MRNHLIPALSLALLFAAPAAAQGTAPAADDPISGDIVSALPHPFEVEEAGDRIGAAVGAIVNVPIGDVVRAIDPAAPVGRRDTIADVAGRGDPDFEGRLQDQVAGLSTKAADVVRGVAAAAPALQRSLAEAMRNLDAALGGLDR